MSCTPRGEDSCVSEQRSVAEAAGTGWRATPRPASGRGRWGHVCRAWHSPVLDGAAWVFLRPVQPTCRYSHHGDGDAELFPGCSFKTEKAPPRPSQT